MADQKPDTFAPTCPLPVAGDEQVLLAHGGGGRLMRRLLEERVFPAFANPLLETGHDAAVFPRPAGGRLAFTTDTSVVRPLFFPGGDIGRLAVNGTVNDLAMAGARPLFLSAGLVLEEGLSMEMLARVLESMQQAVSAASVAIITGDTKVVERGHADGLFINTAGVGVIEHALAIAPRSVRPGDLLLVNGDLGRHGIAVMAARDGFFAESGIESDTAPLAESVLQMIGAGIQVRCLRDLTRGGLASGLVEIAATAGIQVEIDEARIPVHPHVAAACEILGLDPLHVASEGRFVAFAPPDDAERALEILRAAGPDAEPVIIGRVTEGEAGRVLLTSRIGVPRLLEMLSGEQLPRIC